MTLFRNLFASMTSARPKVDGHEVRRMVLEEDAVLLDVRTEAEFESGHARSAINIPLQELASRRAELPRDLRIIVYCRSGGRSATAAALLSREGYEVLDAGGLDNVMTS
ncbi:MAG: rhodanese-like domain-containing protein [Sandaracinaceae bacterium]